jgi:serine/threonine protein kinase
MIENKIGKYKIIRLIGEGGMASVYEAEHEMLGTKVAIKVLNPILSANAQIKERFRNEAKLMASLDHPNITKVIDFDEQPQQLSIVMEFLNGEDLNDKIKRNGPLSEKEITDVFSQTLSAFQYAHEKGIVHRDIKPSNIFILKNGHVKILDFGIAKLFGQGNEMTQTGTQMGTPIYMSPEQVKADKSIDHRSDIYSLGVTMFYAINGKPPYNSDTDSQFDIFNKIVYEPLPELPGQGVFIELIKKSTQKDREQRFQSCKEWIHAAENYVRLELQGQTTISDSLHNELHAEAKENATYQEEIDHQNTESNENSGLNLSSDRDTNNEYNGNNNAVKNKLKGIKLLKWVNIIQITWFSLFVFSTVFSYIKYYYFYFIGEFALLGLVIGTTYFLFLPLNFIYLVIQYKKLKLLGNSRTKVILNICSSPFFISIVILSNHIYWQFDDYSIFRVFFSNLAFPWGDVLLGLAEISFGISTLLKIKKIEAN